MVFEIIRALIERFRAMLGPVEYPAAPTPYYPPTVPTAFPLSVTITPATASIQVNETTSFSSRVSGGTPPFVYEWYLNDVLKASNTDAYAFTASAVGSNRVFLNVTDETGVTKSNTAVVSVVSAPAPPEVPPPPGVLTLEQKAETERLLALVAEMRSVASRKGCSMPTFVEESLAMQYLVTEKIEALGKAQIAVQRATLYVSSIRQEPGARALSLNIAEAERLIIGIIGVGRAIDTRGRAEGIGGMEDNFRVHLDTASYNLSGAENVSKGYPERLMLARQAVNLADAYAAELAVPVSNWARRYPGIPSLPRKQALIDETRTICP